MSQQADEWSLSKNDGMVSSLETALLFLYFQYKSAILFTGISLPDFQEILLLLLKL